MTSLRGSNAPWPAVMISARERYGPPLFVEIESSSSPFSSIRSSVCTSSPRRTSAPYWRPCSAQQVDELLGQDLRIAGDVVDVLLGIHGRDLSAELLEALDDADGGAAVARVVRGRKATRARAENGDVDDVSASTRAGTLVRAAGAAATGGVGGRFALLHLERVPAAAGGGHVRVVDLEAGLLQPVQEVDRRALEVRRAVGIDDDVDAVERELDGRPPASLGRSRARTRSPSSRRPGRRRAEPRPRSPRPSAA